MKKVLTTALSWDKRIHRATSPYLDDILVDQRIASSEDVEAHLQCYGLVCKAAEQVSQGARVLGIRVWGENQSLFWRRDNEGEIPPKLTRRSVFSLCGRLISHLPVCGVSENEQPVDLSFEVGDRVWVRHSSRRCDIRSHVGTVTKITSAQNIEVDGIPRHVRDLRAVAPESIAIEGGNEQPDYEDSWDVEPDECLVVNVGELPGLDVEGSSSESEGSDTGRPLPRRGSRERRPARLFQYNDLP
ncbi:hypothetical protein Pcinc_040836 [Petrolisthes cinctipes]|uniref:DUF7047 domain-containing protein n=1 Tax=Petrolisthes cinctipes TaxID=88211 RepID=A0AAE1BKR3_PETCI|nr:hypothetical protein Pcinc_040836 [Petrolisthes cinctipes]